MKKRGLHEKRYLAVFAPIKFRFSFFLRKKKLKSNTWVFFSLSLVDHYEKFSGMKQVECIIP